MVQLLGKSNLNFEIFLINTRIMATQNQSAKTKLIKLQDLLNSQTKSSATLQYLQELLHVLQKVDIKDEAVAKNQIYEELRDTVKSVFSYLDKIKVASTPLLKSIEASIKQFLLAISHFCSAYYCYYHPLGCGEMIKEFLSSQCRLFVPDFGAAAAPANSHVDLQQQQHLENIEEKNWIWTKESSFKTLFFCECIEAIMRNLSTFEQNFSSMQIPVIGQYVRLLYYMDDYLIQDKFIKLCVENIESLEMLFYNPTKQIMKDANKQKLEEVSEYLTKLLRSHRDDGLKKRIQFLGPILGMTMLKMPSIQKKILGCKIVSKFSYEMLYRSTSYITQNSFGEWIVSQNFFELVFEDHSQASLIKSSQDTFKLLVKKALLKKEQLLKFFQILQRADPEMRKAMFRLIDPFRVDYHQIEAMLQIFKTVRGIEFYDDQFFYFLEGLSRYSTQRQLTNMLSIAQKILEVNYNKFQSYLIRRRSIQCYAYIFERLITYKDLNERIEAYSKVASDFLKEPSQNKLIMLKTLFQNLSEHKMERSYQEILCNRIILDLKFIESSLQYANDLKFRDDLISTVKMILRRYAISLNKHPFSQQTLLATVDFPVIFEEMLKLTSDTENQKLQSLFNQLANLSAVKEFAFSCMKNVFIKLNWKVLKPIKKQYTDVIGTYATYVNPESFVGVDTLKYLIFNSKSGPIRKGACQLLVEIYTNLTDDFREEGEQYLISFMKDIVEVLKYKLKNYLEDNQSYTSVVGTLELMEQLMLNTQYFGTGSLKAHNSLIPTSTVTLKVFNNSTYGDDVLKIFEKKMPSNKTLFEVIVEVSKQFKIGPLDICFQYPNNETIKYNGLTLQELKLNKQEVNAIKLPQSRLKKEPLLVDGKLSTRAIKAFTDMFRKFAPDGKMGSKQCAAYIEGVTLSYCPLFDSRINSLYAQYDTDKDGILVLQDFLRFYLDCVVDPEKLEVVDKNLSNLRYRRDLKLFDEELESLNQQVLFRYHIWNHKEIYEYLFSLTHREDIQLTSLAQQLLLRLPTYPKVISSLSEAFNLKNKKPFQVEYLLTALQSQIAHQQNFSQQLISSKNHLAIFEYLSQLSLKQEKSENEKNCQIICLHLLYSLLGIKQRQDQLLKQFPQLSFSLPVTDVFLGLIRENIKKGDSTLLLPTYSLQLTQECMCLDWIEEAVFNYDKDTREISCGFLYLWILKNKAKDLDLFTIKISPNNNEEWFQLLTLIINLDLELNYNQIFKSKLEEIGRQTESLEENRYNPIIHGNLKIIRQLHHKLTQQEKQSLKSTLTHLLPSLVSNPNRELVYQLLFKDYPEVLLGCLSEMVKVQMGKEAQPRNNFVGIRNLGCICYMNSILQQFFMIKPFRSLIMSLQPNIEESEVNGIKIVDDFLYQLQKMYSHLQWSQKQYYEPTTFCLAIKDHQGKPINTHIQEDAHEFLNSAFDKIEGYSKKEEKLGTLQRIFGGKTVTEIICQTCQNKNEVLEHYYHLTLEVKGMKTLKESFDKMILPQEISDYFCVNCDKKVEKITKQTLIKESPQILIINLQRIVFDLQTFLKVKVHTKLQFQQVLDLHSYFSSSTKPAPYNLKGVVIHSGTSEGGHYYSLIKQNGKWFKFNDQSVTQFSQNDIGRQAFGGDQHTDTLGDLTSSTNAYILVYQRVKNEEDSENDNQAIELVQKLKEEVLQQNQEFKHQLQIYQPSYFTILHALFEAYIDKNNPVVTLELYNIYFKLVEHLSINSDIKTQYINQVRDNFLRLCAILPQKTANIIRIFRKQTIAEIICTHNDVNIRQIYQKILAKSITATMTHQKEGLSQELVEFLSYLLSLLEDDLLIKNTYKSYQFFDLWKELIQDASVRKMMIDKECLGKLLDLLMGNDSSNSTKEKKRPEFSVAEAMPLIPLITNLLESKLNLLGLRSHKKENQTYTQLTQFQKKLLNNATFYRKMMRNKLDMALLAPIISLLSYKDENYSKFIAQILIKSLNSSDQIEDKNIVFQNIKAFLLVSDQLTSERLKWILGIYQIDSISFHQQEFGMMTSPESKVYSYVSSYLFVKDEKYVPLLYSLFEKRKYYNSFSAHGVTMLLELLNQSQEALQYILSLPAPTYVHKTYVDWIETYVNKVKVEDHYGLPLDKNILAAKLQKLLQGYKQKAQKCKLLQRVPVNPWIIGKNYDNIPIETMMTQDYSMDMWVHYTFVLPNKPFGTGNLSLPDQEFSFASTTEPVKAKYFLKALDGPINKDEKPPIDIQPTVITINLKSSHNLILKFKIDSFRHTIYLKSGQNLVNCPYQHGSFQQILNIQPWAVEGQPEPEPEIKLSSVPSYDNQDLPTSATSYNDYDYNCYMEVNCKVCTLLNIGRETCEVCGADLFK